MILGGIKISSNYRINLQNDEKKFVSLIFDKDKNKFYIKRILANY